MAAPAHHPKVLQPIPATVTSSDPPFAFRSSADFTVNHACAPHRNRVGPYEVVALRGAGGMGEVYRAKDAQLKREVVLKVLPAIFARDAERMAAKEPLLAV